MEVKKIEESNKEAALQQISLKIKKLNSLAKKAEQVLNTIFETQENIANEIQGLKNKLILIEKKNKNFVIEKKAFKEFSQKNFPVPIVTVTKTITQGSNIKGPHSSVILKENISRCKIQELASGQEGIRFYEMTISEL